MLRACHDCGRETPRSRYCDRCAAEHRRLDARPRPGRDYRGTKRHADLRAQAWADHNGTCGRCGKPIDPDGPWDLGHVVGHAEGGPLTRSNVRPEHVSCNRSNR
jgi:hypothetical protein